MPYRCVVGGCSRVSTDGLSLYFWPRDEAQAKLWDRFVRSYRLERRALDLLLISSKWNCSTTAPHRRSVEERAKRGNTICCCQILDDIIPESEVPGREKAWIDPKSAAAVKVEELVFNNHRLKDLATLSPHFQTYDLELFHSLLNQFALN
ncbi:hypothetical protein CAPTEDRAFT_202216 [Capitella teleta]|uniref:THAP-type domain-containing protein n=1 Tax=Capitella teleta TaxID=283909 RepID=R7V0Q8_CAPTE|nr:hypothetical protein CAPTEDRAFT_202216 [Capitella teleta]|eukprot:ELU12114.1 hypothetical protein CAPTEDRAFT_202216 [Capitella teleta]